MYNGYKNPEMCFNNQTHFDNQPGFPIGDAVSKQTSAPPWDYTPQPYNSIPNFSGETHLNHRQVPVIHNQNIPQFDRKENSLNIPGHDNSNPLAHYSTNNNSHQSIVRPTALVNCHSNCNACCNHSNRVSHWNVTSDGRYLDNSSSLPKDLPRYPNISSYSHEESKFVGDFASSLNKLSRFSREKANPNHPGFVSPAVEQDHVSPIVNSSAKALNTSSAVSSDSIPVKKDSCATCQDGCQSSCRFFKHQSSVQFPNQDNIHQDQHSISATQENVVRYMGHTALNNATSNQWHMSNRPQTGMWLPNGHYPPFWVQPDNVRMNASGSVSFWGDRNEEISSNISQPMRSSFHGMARYKSHMMNQKVVRLHEAEQKKIQDIARYNEVQRPRYQDPSSNKSEENYQDPGRYHDAQRKAHTVQFRDLPKQSSQTLNYSEAMNKEFAGLAPSSTKLQGISRNTITSSELGQGEVASYPVEQDGTRRYTDISNAHPARSMATHFNTNSQANINFTTGIAQPPSRFSSHVTYTQSKITKTNNYMQCIYPPIETKEKNTNFVPVVSKMAYANSEIVPSNRNQYTSVVKESGSNFEFVTNSVDKNSDVIKYCDSKNSDPGPNYSTLQPCNKMSDSTVLGKTMQVVDCPGLVKTKPYFCNQTLQGSNNFYSDIPRYGQTKVSHSYENLNDSKAYHMFGENNIPANLHSLQQTYQMNPLPAQNSSSAITSNVSILPPDKASSDLEDSSYVDEHNPNIYNRSPFEDGTGRYLKKRRSRLKGISKKSQNLHSNKNNQTLRQYLANWDEECDDVTTNPKLPDVVPSNVESVLVLDYRSLGNDGLSSLQADEGIGRPVDSGLIQMTYQEIDDMNTVNKQSLQNIPGECEHIDGNIGEASLPIQKTSKYVEPTLEDSKEKEPLINISLSQDCQHLEENTSEVTLSPIEDYSKTNSIISPCVSERDLPLNEQEVLENSANNRVKERKGNIVFHQSAKGSLSTTEEHTVHNFETLFSEHSSDSARTNFATGTPSSSVLECPSIGTEDQSPSYSGNQSVLSNKNTNKIPVSDSLLQKSLSTSKNINISNEAIDALLKDCAEFSENILPKLHSQEEVETRCNNVDIDENIDDILQTVNQDNSSTISQNTIFAPINSENKDVVVSENSLTTRTSAIVSTFVKELEKNKEQTLTQPKRIDFKSEKNTTTTPTPCHNTFVDSEIGETPSKQNKLEIKAFSKIVAKQILALEEETTNPYHTSKEQFITNVELQDKEAEVNTSTTSQSSFKNEASFENILGDNTINYSNKENLSSIIGKEVDTPVFEVCGKDKPTIHSIELIKNSSPDVIVTGFEDKDKTNSSDRSLVLQNNKIITKRSAVVQIQLHDDGGGDGDDDDDDDDGGDGDGGDGDGNQCTLSEINNTNVLSEIKLLSTCGEGYQQTLVNHEMKTKLSAKINQKVDNFCSSVTGSMQNTGNLLAKIADCNVQDDSLSKSVNETHKELHLTNESKSSEHVCKENKNNFQSKTIMNTRNIIQLDASQPIAKELTDTDILKSYVPNNNIKSHFASKKKSDSHLRPCGNTVTSKTKNLKSVRIIRSKSADKPRLVEACRPSSHTCEDSSIPKSEQYLSNKIISNSKINSLHTVGSLAKGVPSKKKRPHNLTLSNRKTSFIGLFDTHINVSPNNRSQRVCNNDEPINYIDLDMEVESENESPHEENSTNITVDKIPQFNIKKLYDTGSKKLNHYNTLDKVNSTHNTSNSSNFDLLKSLEEAFVPINRSSNSVESCTISDKHEHIESISILNLNDDESSINQNDQIHLNKFSGSKNNLKKSSNDKTNCFIEESTLNSTNPDTIFRENHKETNENGKVSTDIDIEKSFLPNIEEPDSIERNMEEIHKETNLENHQIITPNNNSMTIVVENNSGSTIDHFKTNENQHKSKDEVQKNVSNSLYQKFGNDTHLNTISTETSKISSIGILIQQLDDNDTVKSSTNCTGIDNSSQKPLVKEDVNKLYNVCENSGSSKNIKFDQNTFLESNSDFIGIVECSLKTNYPDMKKVENTDIPPTIPSETTQDDPDITSELPLTVPLETTQNEIIIANSSIGQCRHIDETLETENVELKKHSFRDSISTNLTLSSNIELDQHIDKKEANNRSTVKFVSSNTHACIISRKVGQAVENIVCKLKKKASQVVANQVIGVEECTYKKTLLQDQNTISIKEVIPNPETKNIATSKIKEVSFYKPTKKNKQSNLSVITDNVADICVHSNELHCSETKNGSQETTSYEPNTNIDIHNSNKINSGRYMVEEMCDDTQNNSLGNTSKTNNDLVFIKSASDRNVIVSSPRKEYISTIGHDVEDNILLNGEHKPSDQCIVDLSIIPNLKTVDNKISSEDHPTSSLISVAFQEQIEENHSKEEVNSRNDIIKEKSINLKSTNSPVDCSIGTSLNSHITVTNKYMALNHTKPGRSIDSESNLVESSHSSEENSPILNEIVNDSHNNKYNSNKNTVECVSLDTNLDNSAAISNIGFENVEIYNKLTMQSHSQPVGDKNISEPESETMERGNIQLFSEEILNFDSKGALNLKMKKENETSIPDINFECQPSSFNKDATTVIMELTSSGTNKFNETHIYNQGTLETSNSKELRASITQNLSHKQTLATNSEEKSITLSESSDINEVSHVCVNQHSHNVDCCNKEQHSLKCCEDTDPEIPSIKHISSHTANITACDGLLDNVSVTDVLDISTNCTVSSINTEVIPQENDLTITRTCSKDTLVVDLPGTVENRTKESTLHSICSHNKFKCDSPKLLRIQADTHTIVFESKVMEVQENGFENNVDNNTNSANVTELSLHYEGTDFVEQSEETHIWPVVVESNISILDSPQIVIITGDDEDNTTPCYETNAGAVPISPEMPCLEPFTVPENVVAICNESDFEMPILNVSENTSLVVSDGNKMPQLEVTVSSIISTAENNDNSSETLPHYGEHERHLENVATSLQESIIEPYKSVPHNYTHGSDSISKPFIFERHCHEESLECSLISNEMRCSLTKTPEIIPTDSVSNWPYLEEEVPSELQVSDSESTVPLPKYFHGIIDSNGILTAPPLSPIPSSDEETLPRQTNFKMMLSSAYRKTNNEKGKSLNFFKCRKSLKSEHFAVNPHNGLKCQLSWNRIFALSKIDECKKLKTTKNKQKRDVSKGWPYYGKSPMRWTRIKETDDYKSHLVTTDQIIRTLAKEDHSDLLPGTSNVKVCLTPKSHHERETKNWSVVDPSGSGESSHWSFVEENNNDLITASQNAKQDELYNNQVPIVLVKKLVLKREADGKIGNECEHLPKFAHSSEDDDDEIKKTDAANAIGRKTLVNTEGRNTTPCSNVSKNADIELNSTSLDIEAIEKNLPSTLAKCLEQGRSNIITSTNSPRMCDFSAACSLSGAESCDGSEKHVPRVIIKRTGSGTNYKSFLRESSYSTNFWQPVVRIQRNKDLDNLSRSLVKSDCPKKVVHLNRLRLVIRRQSSFEREKVMKNNVHQVAFVTNVDPTSMNEIENIPSVKQCKESLEKKEIFTYAVENNAKKPKLTSHRQRNELNTRLHDTEIRYLKHNKPQSYGQLCSVKEKQRLKCPTIPEQNKVRAHNEIKKKHSEMNRISQSSYVGIKDQCIDEKNERKRRRYSECSHNILGYHIAKVSRKRISEGGININEKGKNINAFADNIPYYKKRFAMGSDYEEESIKDSMKNNQTGSKESVENMQSSLLVQDSMSAETLIHSQISRSHIRDDHSHSKVTNSRENSTTDLSEKHIVLKEGSKECEIKQLKKRSSNSSRVPETCQVCGSHYKDKAEKIEHVKEHLYHCQQCHIAFNSKGEFVRHRSSRHPRTKEQHHCLLCQRTFPTLQRHQLHLSGHLHRHLETAQRRTIHTLFRLFTGNDCPALTPLSEEEASGVSWFPAEGGAIHFYHQAPPLQIAVQDYIWKRRDMGGSADDSNIHEPSHDAGTSTR